MVDARDDQVRFFLQKPGNGKMHAIRRRAIDKVKTIGCLADDQRPVQGQGIAGAAAIAFRGNDCDLAQSGKTLREDLDARGK